MKLALAKAPPPKRKHALPPAAPLPLSSESWLTKHHPGNMNDVSVAVHTSYRKNVKDWLVAACQAHGAQEKDGRAKFVPWVLALCGPSGCGKSTLVEALCKDMDIDVVVWHDDMWELQSAPDYSSWASGNQGGGSWGGADWGWGGGGGGGRGGGTGGGGSARMNKEERRNKAEEMEAFVIQSKYPKLVFRGGASTGASSSGAGAGAGSGAANASATSTSTCNVVTARDAANNKGPSFGPELPPWRRIILIHDPPHLMASDASRGAESSAYVKQQQRMCELLLTFKDPVVLIVSDVGGRDDVMYAASCCVPRNLQHLVNLQNIFCGGCTPKNIAKVLRAIRDRERLPQADVPDSLLDSIAENSGGDVRHAVLQFEYAVRSSPLFTRASEAGAGAGAGPGAGASAEARAGAGSIGFDFSLADSSLLNKVSGLDVADVENDATTTSQAQPSDGVKRKGGPDSVAPAAHGSSRPLLLIRGEDSDGHLMDYLAATKGKSDGRVERRDARYSSLHSAAKIVRAALDRRGHLNFDCDQVVYKSELDPELLVPFVQFNVVKSLEATTTVENYALPPPGNAEEASSAEPAAGAPAKRRAVDTGFGISVVIEDETDASAATAAPLAPRCPAAQVSAALSLCSDLELMLAQKYDPSAHLDRANNIFPNEYACCLLARVGCGARGVGAEERIASGKKRGAKSSFNPTFRPKVFDLGRNRLRVEGNLCALRDEFLSARSQSWAVEVAVAESERERGGGASAAAGQEGGPVPPRLYASSELRMTLVPYMLALSGGGRGAARFGAPVYRHLAVLDELMKKCQIYDDYTVPVASFESEQYAESTNVAASLAGQAGGIRPAGAALGADNGAEVYEGEEIEDFD